MIAQAKRYTQIKPTDGDGWSDLGLAYQRTRRFAAGVPAYVRSLALLKAAAAKTPTQDAIADVADTSLDLANVYVSLGDVAGTRSTFAQADAYGDRLDPRGRYANLKRNVKERTQEGLIAVELAGGNGERRCSRSRAGAVPIYRAVSNRPLKYRLIVASAGDAAVTLHAAGLAPAWVASFCADGLCSPQQVSFRAPATGVKTYEFQLVPPEPGARPGTGDDQRRRRQYRQRSASALRRAASAAALLLAFALSAFGGARADDPAPAPSSPATLAKTVVTHHVVHLANGDALAYTATAGTLTLRNDHSAADREYILRRLHDRATARGRSHFSTTADRARRRCGFTSARSVRAASSRRARARSRPPAASWSITRRRFWM